MGLGAVLENFKRTGFLHHAHLLIGRPEEVARLVAALCCEDIPYLTGETIYVDGGHGIAH